MGTIRTKRNRNTHRNAPRATQSAKGYGGTETNRAKTGECDSKKFFFVKISRSGCAYVVGIALRGRVAREWVIVSGITVPRWAVNEYLDGIGLLLAK